MHSVNIEMIQFLVVLVVRDDSKSSGAHPDPEVFLKGLCGIERPYLSASHLYKPEVGMTSSLASVSTWQKSCDNLAELDPG